KAKARQRMTPTRQFAGMIRRGPPRAGPGWRTMRRCRMLAPNPRRCHGPARPHDEDTTMPMIDADGCLLNVSVEGRDGGPTLMLSNSLGCNLQMWEPQMKAVTQVFRVIRYDRRGERTAREPTAPSSAEHYLAD